jgi:hypothetical protein
MKSRSACRQEACAPKKDADLGAKAGVLLLCQSAEYTCAERTIMVIALTSMAGRFAGAVGKVVPRAYSTLSDQGCLTK